MPQRSRDLHGNVPETAAAALLLIDVINDFDYPGGGDLLRHTLAMAPRLADLKRRCKDAGIPSIYVNDNFGRWQSDFSRVLEHCRDESARGCKAVARLAPDADDYFVLKPKHSGFYHTTLEIVLEHLGAKTLILTGIAGNNCVLFTANDAYLRDYRLFVPGDCTVSEEEEDNDYALRQMAKVLKADTRPGADIDLKADL